MQVNRTLHSMFLLSLSLVNFRYFFLSKTRLPRVTLTIDSLVTSMSRQTTPVLYFSFLKKSSKCR